MTFGWLERVQTTASYLERVGGQTVCMELIGAKILDP